MYLFDIGDSFQSLTETFGGSYRNVGPESQDSRLMSSLRRAST